MAERLLNPKQELFLSYYTDPKSETFSNALQSALKAGYAQEYSESITSLLPDWLSESLGDTRRLKKAEKNLDEVQNITIVGEDGKIDAQLVDKRTKVDMFVLERLNKPKYSTRQELTGADGKDLIPDQESRDKANALIDSYLHDHSGDTKDGDI